MRFLYFLCFSLLYSYLHVGGKCLNTQPCEFVQDLQILKVEYRKFIFNNIDISNIITGSIVYQNF